MRGALRARARTPPGYPLARPCVPTCRFRLNPHPSTPQHQPSTPKALGAPSIYNMHGNNKAQSTCWGRLANQGCVNCLKVLPDSRLCEPCLLLELLILPHCPRPLKRLRRRICHYKKLLAVSSAPRRLPRSHPRLLDTGARSLELGEKTLTQRTDPRVRRKRRALAR